MTKLNQLFILLFEVDNACMKTELIHFEKIMSLIDLFYALHEIFHFFSFFVDKCLKLHHFKSILSEF